MPTTTHIRDQLMVARLGLVLSAAITVVAGLSGYALLASIPFVAGLLLLAFCSALSTELKAQTRRERWYASTEPMLRNAPGYPGDWRLRRVEVFLRARGMCESCGKVTGKLMGGGFSKVPPEKAWHFEHTEVRGAHVHHKVEISRGGSHTLSNLELLCDDCHATKHPNNPYLQNFRANVEKQRRKRSVQRSLHIGDRASVKRARREWPCYICERTISMGEEYFGGGFLRICMKCKEGVERG